MEQCLRPVASIACFDVSSVAVSPDGLGLRRNIKGMVEWRNGSRIFLEAIMLLSLHLCRPPSNRDVKTVVVPVRPSRASTLTLVYKSFSQTTKRLRYACIQNHVFLLHDMPPISVSPSLGASSAVVSAVSDTPLVTGTSGDIIGCSGTRGTVEVSALV